MNCSDIMQLNSPITASILEQIIQHGCINPPGQEPSPAWLVNCYYGSGIAVAIFTLGGLWFAICQLRALLAQSEHQTRTAEATFMFELDKRWEGQDMVDARRAFETCYDKIHNKACENHPKVNATSHLDKIQEEFSKHLILLRQDKIDEYQDIMKIMGFFETLGIFVRKNYTSKEEIIDLYGGSILKARSAFVRHINDIAREKGSISGIYEHSLWIFEEANKFATEKGWNKS